MESILGDAVHKRGAAARGAVPRGRPTHRMAEHAAAVSGTTVSHVSAARGSGGTEQLIQGQQLAISITDGIHRGSILLCVAKRQLSEQGAQLGRDPLAVRKHQRRRPMAQPILQQQAHHGRVDLRSMRFHHERGPVAEERQVTVVMEAVRQGTIEGRRMVLGVDCGSALDQGGELRKAQTNALFRLWVLRDQSVQCAKHLLRHIPVPHRQPGDARARALVRPELIRNHLHPHVLFFCARGQIR